MSSAGLALNLGMLNKNNPETAENSDFELKPMDPDSQIKFSNGEIVSNQDGTKTTTVSYTISPTNADINGFTSALIWNSEASDIDSNTWDGGQNIDEYVSYSINTSTKVITLNFLKSFGREIKFIMTSNAYSNIKGTITVNCVRKLTKDPTYQVRSAFEDGQTMTVSYNNASFSLGSKGSRTTHTPNILSCKYIQTGSTTLISLFPQITALNFSYGNMKYPYFNEGKETTDYAGIRTEMIKQVDNYICSLVSHQASEVKPIFSKKALLDLMTVEYITYYSYKENWGYYSDYFYTFINNYKTKCTDDSKAGYFISAGYEENTTLYQREDITIVPDGINNFGISIGNIDF